MPSRSHLSLPAPLFFLGISFSACSSRCAYWMAQFLDEYQSAGRGKSVISVWLKCCFMERLTETYACTEGEKQTHRIRLSKQWRDKGNLKKALVENPGPVKDRSFNDRLLSCKTG